MTKPLRQIMDILDDDPITLAEASKVVLRGVVTVSALRAEIERGNLAVEKIGKNLYTTKAAIREMRDRCREKLSRRGSTSEKTDKVGPSGSSGTTDGTDELVLLKGIVAGLKDGSLTTSRKSTSRGQHTAGSPIPFPSRK